MARRNGQRSTTPPSKATRWLDHDEEAAWRAIAMTMVKLRWALECQLQRDAELSFIEYHTLARLSEEPNHTLRMSELAGLTHQSLSRLSHLVKRLEGRALVRREPDAADRRFTNAILTDTGYAKLVASAPENVETVRALVIDPFSAAELQQLREASERMLARIDAQQGRSAATQAAAAQAPARLSSSLATVRSLPFGLGNRPSGVHQPDVAERLGEVSEELPGAAVDLFRQ